MRERVHIKLLDISYNIYTISKNLCIATDLVVHSRISRNSQKTPIYKWPRPGALGIPWNLPNLRYLKTFTCIIICPSHNNIHNTALTSSVSSLVLVCSGGELYRLKRRSDIFIYFTLFLHTDWKIWIRSLYNDWYWEVLSRGGMWCRWYTSTYALLSTHILYISRNTENVLK